MATLAMIESPADSINPSTSDVEPSSTNAESSNTNVKSSNTNIKSSNTNVESSNTNIDSSGASVEPPTADMAAPPPYTTESSPLHGNVREVPPVNQEYQDPGLSPITTSLWRTRRHLRSIGGIRSYFRGSDVSIAMGIWVNMLSNTGRDIPNIFFQSFITIVAYTLCTGIYVLWVHTVISAPSSKVWFQRLVSYSKVIKVMQPSALCALSVQLACLVLDPLAYPFGIPKQNGDDEMHELDAKALVPILCSILIIIFFYFPTSVVLVRVAASVLPEEEATIVNVDRTFGGRLAPGETLKILDAWKSFTWEGIMRVISIYFKVILLQLLITTLYGVAIAGIFLVDKKH